MKYMIGERVELGPTDNDWRLCEKCKCLFSSRGIERSDCAAGGRHEFNPMSFNFQLPHSTPGISHQAGWRSCDRCTGIFFSGSPGSGVCPAPVESFHEPDGFGFFLSHGFGPLEDGTDATHQDKWRFCMDCYGLFFEPNHISGCPAKTTQRIGRFPILVPLCRPTIRWPSFPTGRRSTTDSRTTSCPNREITPRDIGGAANAASCSLLRRRRRARELRTL
jgi:hypothetical protein